MANWITHTFLAETLLMQGLPLDKRGFCIGNIAPDCNVENADWSVFTPPREVTHWMTGTSKLTSDYEGFYRKYIDNNQLQCSEEFSFFWGYYCHLITDVLYQKFVRDPDRISACFRRLFKVNSNTVQLPDSPQTFDTLKKIFGKKRIFQDIEILENNIIFDNPDCAYNQVLRNTYSFPDYLSILPSGSIARKIPRMTYNVNERFPEVDLIFFTQEEYQRFLLYAVYELHEILKAKGAYALK